jgi:hypothetical protein
MTDSLLKCYSDSFVYNANNCHNIIFWAEEFKCFEANDTDVFQPIYVGIFDFWMNKVALVLSDATRNNSDLKYNNNFFYLNQRLTDYKYAIGIKYSNTEKVIENIVNGKWSYLLKRYFLETSTFINLLLVFFLVLTIYTYYLFLISFFKKKNSNKYSGEL